MPELPEVETVARTLARQFDGACFTAGHILWPGVLDADHGALPPDAFLAAVPDARVLGAWRRGKALIIDLAAPAHPLLHLGVHLRMTGRLTVEPPGTAPRKHTHLVLDLADGRRLFYTDARKFGRVRAMPPAALPRWPFYAALGPEPLDIGPDAFADLFAGRRGRMKALLLDQHFLAGVGNIYADESLFRAGIRPDARADRVSRARRKRLYGELADVLREAIAANGSSIRNYVNAEGDAGAFQNDFRVYGRAGEPCRRCARPLIRCTVAGRTTVYCRTCQR